MKLSANTLAILKNFSTINGNFWVSGTTGNKISTISPMGNIFAHAEIEESFGQEFCIYDLNDFLSILSITDDPDIILHSDHFEISWKNSQIRYLYADKSIFSIENSSFKHLQNGFIMPECEIAFSLDADTISSIRKASSILKAQNLSIASNDGIIQLKTYDKTNPNSNLYEISLPDTTSHEFNMVLSIDNLKTIVGDYSVTMSSKNIAQFEKTTGDIRYYIAMDSTSNFGG